jgi:broad specificity phosphatase PhoE
VSATFLLIRHAAIDGLGVRIVGRTAGVHLNGQGRAEAECLARRLSGVSLSAVYASPRERAQETAEAIGRATGIALQTKDELDEVDFGDWTGKDFRELDTMSDWRGFNSSRNSARIPRGESMLDLTKRADRAITALREEHPSDCIALVSHADWVRAAAASQLGLSLDTLGSFEVSPASVTILQFDQGSARITRWNDTGDLRHVL